MADTQIVQHDEQKAIRSSFDAETFKTMIAIADKLHAGGSFVSSFKNAAQVFTAIQAGYEMGIPPIESMGSFYMVNGKLSLYGSALSKRLRKHGWKIATKEHDTNKCTVEISKGEEKFEYTATAEDVKKLGVQAFNKAPKDKLFWHALSRLIRYYVPEVMGSVSYTVEEMDGNDSFDKKEAVTITEAPVVDLEKIEIELGELLNEIKTMEEYQEKKEALVSKLQQAPYEKQKEYMVKIQEFVSKLKKDESKVIEKDDVGTVFPQSENNSVIHDNDKK